MKLSLAAGFLVLFVAVSARPQENDVTPVEPANDAANSDADGSQSSAPVAEDTKKDQVSSLAAEAGKDVSGGSQQEVLPTGDAQETEAVTDAPTTTTASVAENAEDSADQKIADTGSIDDSSEAVAEATDETTAPATSETESTEETPAAGSSNMARMTLISVFFVMFVL